jgi:hypothetical protein
MQRSPAAKRGFSLLESNAANSALRSQMPEVMHDVDHGPGPAFDVYGQRVYDTRPTLAAPPLQRALEHHTGGELAMLRPISRLPEASSTAEAAPAPSPNARQTIGEGEANDESTANAAGGGAAPDIEALAQQVYDILRRRLQIDSERRGRF